MQDHFTIELKGLLFQARHGLYKEESLVGNSFEVDLALEYSLSETIHSLDQTINYAAVFSVTRGHMEAAKPLLETCAQELAQKLKDQFPQLQRAEIRIVKLQPPITGFTGTVGVKLSRDFR